ncbi:pilus assembly protein PilM [Cellulomonas sp. RIT-PI-Y]|uniref:pilus assembly protein PilM n=1 Tax=Cellulomonas sp. RIT-PI-Y TaxID=3035297 RepID=UPI0021DAD935|nr:pilus assembly protein PilM [Cellulomonas sp. RIT-PI-Y]
MPKTRVVGLDLGTRGVRAAEVELGGRSGPKLVRFGEQPLDPGVIRDGEVARPAAVVAALRELWKRERFGSREVALGIGNQRVFVREFSQPALPLDQLRASLRYGPVQDLLPVKVEDCLLDFHPVALPGDGTVDGMLVAAPEETVETNTSAVTAAGLKPVRVDLNAFALLRSLIEGQLLHEVVGIVDVGAGITDVVIVDRGLLRQYRTLPTASDDLTHAVQQAMAVPETQAEQIKRSVGLTDAGGADYAPAREAARRRVEGLAESVRATFSYYAGATQRPVERLLLTGRGSLVPGLAQLLATGLGVRVAYGQVGTDRVSDLQRPVLPIAFGLAQGLAA